MKVRLFSTLKTIISKKQNPKFVRTLGLNSGDDSVHLDTGRLMNIKKIDGKLGKI